VRIYSHYKNALLLHILVQADKSARVCEFIRTYKLSASDMGLPVGANSFAQLSYAHSRGITGIGANPRDVGASPPLAKGDLGGFNKPLKSPLSPLFKRGEPFRPSFHFTVT
jgi:hypothetical protein